jgi:hypothetical protein
MYQENNHYHYSEEEVRDIFRKNLDCGNWQISQSEYRNFCKLLSCINKEFVDMLNDEILIVIFSLEKKERMDNRRMPCCFINLKDEAFLKAKKGVMVFSPYLLTLSCAYNKLYKIFHEIAYYELNHPMVAEKDAGREYDRNAKELALEWLQQELDHLNALSASKTKQHRE